MNENISKMAEMNVRKLILVMSLPAIVSMLVQALYNVVDSIFIAQIGKEALTAVSLAFPVQMVMISISVGLTIGINSYVSRKIGEKKLREAASAAEHGIILGIFFWLIIAVGNFFLVEWFYSFFSDDPVVIGYTLQYTNIVVYGSFGFILSLVLISIQQATGDMISSMKIQLVGAVINLILDPIMIFGLFGFPELDVAGGALATIIGQIVSMIYALQKLRHNPLQISLQDMRKNFSLDLGIVKEIMVVGLPSMFLQGLNAIMVGGINFILVSLSPLAIAAFGAFFKLNAIIIMPVIGLTQGMMPVVGFNFGAKNKMRVKKAIKYSMIYAVIFMIAGAVLLNIFARPLMQVFSQIPELVELAVTCTRVISISFAAVAITIIVSSAFQAFGIAKLSLAASFLRQIILLLPLAYIMGQLFGVTGVWIAFPVTEIMSLFFTVCYAIRLFRTKVTVLMAD